MKKTIWLLALVLCVCCGCGKNSDSSKKMVIGVSIPAASHGWSGGVVWFADRIEKRMEQENPDTDVVTIASADTADQVNSIENLLARGVNALVIMTQEPAPLQEICERAKAKGVFLVIVSNPLNKPVQDIFVNGDNKSFGTAAAEAMGKLLNGKGKIVAMEGYSSPINTERMTAFKETLQKKYPEVILLASDLANYNAEKALALMENYLQKYPEIDAVWAGDDDALLGAVKAIREYKGKHRIQAVIGGGGSKKVIKMIMDEDPVVKATVTYPPAMIETGVQAALQGLRNGGKAKKAEIIIPSEIITGENAEKHYIPDSVY